MNNAEIGGYRRLASEACGARSGCEREAKYLSSIRRRMGVLKWRILSGSPVMAAASWRRDIARAAVAGASDVISLVVKAQATAVLTLARDMRVTRYLRELVRREIVWHFARGTTP